MSSESEGEALGQLGAHTAPAELLEAGTASRPLTEARRGLVQAQVSAQDRLMNQRGLICQQPALCKDGSDHTDRRRGARFLPPGPHRLGAP